jgi:hypothetical protein
VTRHGPAEHFAGFRIECREQRQRAMPVVLESVALRPRPATAAKSGRVGRAPESRSSRRPRTRPRDPADSRRPVANHQLQRFVALNRIRGLGSGTGPPSLTYQADMGIMVGEYLAADGKHYNASFGFI